MWPQKSNKNFKIGQRVKWNPPPGAYGPRCLQKKLAGQEAVVSSFWNETYLLADFGHRQDVLLNLDYVEAV